MLYTSSLHISIHTGPLKTRIFLSIFASSTFWICVSNSCFVFCILLFNWDELSSIFEFKESCNCVIWPFSSCETLFIEPSSSLFAVSILAFTSAIALFNSVSDTTFNNNCSVDSVPSSNCFLAILNENFEAVTLYRGDVEYNCFEILNGVTAYSLFFNNL